jgi:guanylate kinase
MSKFTVLVGRSASGKDAILKKLVSDYNYIPLISCTTRPKRDGEVDNVTYYFISDYKFKSMIKDNKLTEYRSYNTFVNGNKATWYYGLPKVEVNINNSNYVVILDLEGAESFIDYYGKDNCEIIYIECGAKTRTERAKKRGGFDKQEWDRRLKKDDIDFDIMKRSIVNRTIDNENQCLDDVVKEIVNG